ncbi:D-amino acid dehydrogenase [Xenophilus azovorans]|uniref:D-amino acid dehydrogenase n=1 Tax=Xenophilus azovorans TaxID=151755 RepID=UPI00056F83D6|nr:D-amino acid dehydrogenase [Xenophilus azovorans]
MHICVLGAGIVGLACAWELQRQGHQVTVVDQATPGAGTSSGNGAQLSYSYVAPLADASIWRQLPHLLLAGDSPLKLRPRLDPQQWRWGLAFLAACNARAAADGTARLLSLAAVSRVGFEAMRAELAPGDAPFCDFSATGKLVLYRSREGLEAAGGQIALQRRLGAPEQAVVTPEECVRLEPALAQYARRIAGGVHTPSECAADCLKVCQALAAALAQRGVRFVLGHAAEAFDLRAGRVQAVQTAAGPVQADLFVMALGTASVRFGRQLGAYLPVYPLKGYSITVPVDAAPGAAPRVSVTDTARKTVFARLGDRLRVAGMAELVGEDLSIPQDRIDTLVAATKAVFPQAARDFGAPQPWAGLRPATPRGTPIVGRVGRAPRNMLFNTGHGALGFTLAFGSAAGIAALAATDL